MANDKNLKGVYETLKREGYTPPEYDVFVKDMQDDRNLRGVHATLTKEGYTPPAYDQFKVDMFGEIAPVASAPAPKPQQEKPVEPDRAMRAVQGAMDAVRETVAKPTGAEEHSFQSRHNEASAPAQQAPLERPQTAPQQGWQPTEREKIRMAMDLNTELDDFRRNTQETTDRLRRSTMHHTSEGRRKLKAAETQARLAGVPTRAAGITPGAQAPAQNQEGADNQESGARMLSGQGPMPYGVRYVDGKPKTEWLLPDGSLTTDLIEADKAEYGARNARLMNDFVDRMKRNGLDPARQEDIGKQQVVDAMTAGRSDDLDPEARDEILGFMESEGLDPRNREHVVWTLNGDLRSIVQWQKQRTGRQLAEVNAKIARWEKEHPREAAMARSTPLLSVSPGANPYAEERRRLTNLLAAQEEAIRKYDEGGEAQGRTWGGKILQGLWDGIRDPNTWSLGVYGGMASEARRNDPGAAMASMLEAETPDAGGFYSGGRFVGEMMGDPVTYLSLGAGAGAEALFKTGVTGAMRRTAWKGVEKQAAERLLNRSLVYRMGAGAAAGGGNFAVFEGARDMRQQLLDGGWTDSEGRFHEGFSWAHALRQGGHGLLLGSAMGVWGRGIGNAGDWAVKRVEPAAGKVATRGVQHAVGVVGEGTIFAMPEIYEFHTMDDAKFDELYAHKFGYDTETDDTRRKAARESARDSLGWDAWTESQANILGMKVAGKLTHPAKGIGHVSATLAELRRQGERDHVSFAEKLSRMMDRSPLDVALTGDEREELRRAGYGSLAELLSPDGRDGSEAPAHDQEGGRRLPRLDGYSAMERLMQDEGVSEAARAKAYYMLTGRMLPMSTVMGYRMKEGADGRVTVRAVNTRGGAVTSRTFRSKAAAELEIEKIERQTELNSVDIGESNREALVDEMLLETAIGQVSAGADVEAVKRVYRAVKAGSKEATESQVELAGRIDEAMERNRDAADGYRPEAIRAALREEYGVDVDDALRKTPGRRTAKERGIVEAYLERLFPEEMKKEGERQEPTPEQREAQGIYEEGRSVYDRFEQGDPEAQPAIDAISLRMTEARQLCEDAFGDEAEVYMARLQENAWEVLDDPELTPDQRDAVLYYINSRSALDGVLDASDEAAEEKRQAVGREIEHRTHRGSGMIVPATMKADDKPVYVISGEVVMFPDGSGVDVAKTKERNPTGVIYVLDESGEYKPVSADQIKSVGDPIDPWTELQEAFDAIGREQEAIFGKMEDSVAEAPAQDQITREEVPQERRQAEAQNPTPEEAVIKGGISGTAEGLKAGFDAERERIGNEWLDVQHDVISQYAKGATSVEEIINRAKGDSELDRTKQRLDTLLEFDSTRQKLEAILHEANAPQTALSRIPVDEATQEPQFTAVDPETGWDGLVEAMEGEANALPIARQMIEDARKRLEALDKKPPVAAKPKLSGKGSPMAMRAEQKRVDEANAKAQADYRQALADTKAEIEAWSRIVGVFDSRNAQKEAARKAAEEEERLWEERKSRIDKRLRATAEKYRDIPEVVELLGHMEPMSADEVAAYLLSRYKVLWKSKVGASGMVVKAGVGYHVGIGEAERRKLIGLFASEAKGGMSIERLAGDLFKEVCEEYGIPYDNQEALNELIDMIRGSGTMGEIRGYIADKRVEQAERMGEHVRAQEEEMDEQFHQETYGMSRREYEAYEEQLSEQARELFADIDETEFFSNFADETIERQTQEDEYRRDKAHVASGEGEDGGGGGEVLPEPQATEAGRGDGTPGEETRGGLGDRAKEHDQDGGLSEGASRRAEAAGLNGGAEAPAQDQISAGLTGKDGENAVTLQHGKGSEQNNDERAVARQDDGGRVASDAAGSLEGARDRSDIRVYEKGLAASRDEHSEYSERDRREAESERLVGGERGQDGGRTADSGGGAEADSREREDVLGRSLTREEATHLISRMESNAGIAPEIELTIENWDAQFGEDGIVSTPIGDVKMGENQFTKLMRQGRNGKLGMVRPTLEDPDIIIEDASEGKEARATERRSSYVFVKTFIKPDGSRYYYFTSVTVSRDGHEVVISNQEKRRNVLTNLLMKGKLVWKHADNVSSASDVADGLYSSQGKLSDPASEGTDAPQTNKGFSDGKDNTLPSEKQENEEKSSLGERISEAEAAVDTDPTEAQKEAGNYRKGHVQVGTFDVTIENPKGSKRSGTDPDGKKWETTMTHTYGYIRGTEGVDGDHIDVYLSSDIDGWNGRKVFVVDQYNPDGTFDEHKVMLGFNDRDEAFSAYLSNYESGWEKWRRLDCTEVNLEDFEKWIESSHRKTKAFADYRSVKAAVENESPGDKPADAESEDAVNYAQIGRQKNISGLRNELNNLLEFANDKYGTRYSDIDSLINWAARANKGINAIYRIADKIFHPEQASEFKRGVRDYLKARRSDNGAGRGKGSIGGERRKKPGGIFHSGSDHPETNPVVYEAAKGLVEAAGIEVVEVDDAAAQAMLHGHEKTPVAGQPNRANEKPTSGSVLLSISGNSSSNRAASKEADAKLRNRTQSAKRKISQFNNGDFIIDIRDSKKAIQGIGKLFGMDTKGGSRYAVLQTDGGRTVAVRLSDHGANGNNFRQDGADRNLSVVIERRKFDTPDSEIEFTEATIPEATFMERPHEAVAAIVKGVEDVLADREFTLDSSLGTVEKKGGGVRFSIGSDSRSKAEVAERDKAYMDAVERGDMETAQRMVDEAAEEAGYVEDSSYQGTSAFNGAAPYNGYGWSKDERRELWEKGEFEGDHTLGDYVDFMGEPGDQLDFLLNHPNGLRSASAMGRESIMAIREAIRKGDRKITVYRSVPSSVKEGSLRDGDWVTPSKAYAKDNAAVHGWVRKYRIIEQTVDFDDLWWDGNDINEWGFDSGSRSGYKNTRNNRKLLDAVTYDDQGNVIPLSKRFDQRKSDIRFLKNGEGRVYGWTAGGKVYLNRDAMNPETPVHEYTHLWDEMVMRENPELWERGKELMKRTPVWDEVTSDPNYADIRDDEDAVASEVHSRLTGARGAEILEGMIDSAGKDGAMATAEAVTLVGRIKAWLADMFRALRSTLGKWSGRELADLTAEDFAGLTLRDLAEGMDPRTEMRRGRVARDVTEANPMLGDYHRGVRSRDDVLTFAEVLREAEEAWAEYGDLTYPDMDIDMLRQAAETGRITVYSSKPIATGVFVTPSRMNAEDYAGGGRVYSRDVSVDEVAWTGEDEGQYAPGASAEDSAGRVRLSAGAPGMAGEPDGRHTDEGSADGGGNKYRLVEEGEELDWLESLGEDELVHVYRNVQILPDGTMASPMAAYNVETGEIRRLSPGRWNGPEERQIILSPEQEEKLATLKRDGEIGGKNFFQISKEMRFFMTKKEGVKLQFNLTRDGSKDMWADYNPYDHAIKVMLNDQFKAAWKRPNLVVVEAVMPKSEIEGGYKAPYAALPTGEHKWNNGRSLYLSRWSKIVRIVPFAEVAADIDRYWRENPSAYKGSKVTDYDRFQPQVREELERLGYRFEDKGGRGSLSEAERGKAYESENAIYITNEDIERMNAEMSKAWQETPATERALAPQPKTKEEAERLVMLDRVEDLSEKLDTPIRIITKESELQAVSEDGKPRYSRRERRAKGWWSARTGEVVVVLPNNKDVADVENTVLHEVVGHKGLRAFIGEERFDEFLGEVYAHAADAIRARIDKATDRMVSEEADRLREQKRKAHERAGEDYNSTYYSDMAEARVEAEKKREECRREATEEYMADLGGRIGDEGFTQMARDELTLWGKIKAKVQRFLDKFLRGLRIAKSMRLTDKDLSYILFKSWKNARERRMTPGDKPAVAAGIFAEAEDVVRRQGTRFSEPRERDRMALRKEAVANRTEDLFRQAASGDLKGKPVEIGRLTEAGREYLEKLSGIRLKDNVRFMLNPSDLQHINRRHFGDNEKDGGNVPLTIEDIRFISEVVNNPDKVIYGKETTGDKRNMFFFLKGSEDGSYNMLEVYANAWGNLTSKSFFKSKKSVSQRAMLLKESPALTSVTDGPTLSDGAKLPNFFEYPKLDGEEDTIRFRDGDLGLEEAITKMKADALRTNDYLDKRLDMMAALGENLSRMRQAMSWQREYDITTVKSMTDLSKILLDAGLLDDLSKYETKRILSAIKDAVGREDTSKQVQRLMDIMVDNQLRMGANYFGKLLSVKGSRVDARGIEVQGELDPDGQKIAQTVRRATTRTLDDIENMMAEAMNRMGSADQAVADEAALEYSGLQIAHQYVEEIRESKNEEKELRESIREAESELKLGHMDKNSFRQYKAATEDAIRQNKIDRAEAYRSLSERLGGVLGESVERAKAWREAEKRRVEDIHHNANSDMEGRPTNEHHKEDRLQKFVNNGILRFVLAPLGTFDQMLRMFGRKSVRGEGYLWNRYMRGWVDCTEKEYTGYREALKTLDRKVSEVFGKDMKWGDLFAMERRMPKASVRFWDGGEMRDHELTQGNLLYIYMVDKMTDGRMKLRRMGITEDDVERIRDFVDPRFIELADWMQEEFLVEKRNEYNEVHKRMFGASMAAIENYFPLKILANARMENVDVADDSPSDKPLPATSTGSIIKRRRNNLALDVTGADAFGVILDHIQQMERWAAFAEYNRDLNTLLSYKRFRNQVMNMTSAYGAGKTLWSNFRNVAAMAAGAYRPPIAPLDKAAVNVAKGVTAAKVSFRVFTALKQFLSMPAYLSDSNPVHLATNLKNPVNAWNWSMENLPLFEKRWKSRMAGDPRLLKSDMDWKMWRSRVVEIAGRVGMSPNAFVDALTVAIGAHSMYQTKLAKYKRYGYTPEQAKKRALQDATILFNQTQQSSEGAFLSTMQVDRSWLSVLFTVFRNSSMSYTRQLYDAIRNLSRVVFKPGYKNLSVEFMAKQMVRDGIDPDKATDNAKMEYRRGIIRDLVRVGIFGFGLQLAWNLGAYLPYLIFGNDSDEKDKMWDDALNHAMFGSVEGLTGGDVMSAAGEMWMNGEWKPKQLAKDMPLASDVMGILEKMDKDYVSAMNDVVNLLVQSGLGVNPQTLTDAAVAVMDFCGEDAKTSRECALLISRILNCPQSQIDKIYFDEIEMTGEEVAAIPKDRIPEEIAERYAEYKLHRNAPLTGWAYSDKEHEKVIEKHREKARNTMKERINSSLARPQHAATLHGLLDGFDAEAEREKELNRIKKTDRAAWREGMRELYPDSVARMRHNRVKRYNHSIDRLTEKWLNAGTPEDADSIARAMVEARDRLLSELEEIEAQ